ncbi:MAG: FkbM family methyltransferase [Anaerolineae bacterium]|nr:FkbM family methyltransferase [Anaerolineae bacterium]
MHLRRRLWEALIRAIRPRLDLTYTARSGLACGLRRRGGLGFLPGRPLTPEERWLAAQPWAGKVVYDVGAWEGVFTLFFARAVGQVGAVVAFEPNPQSVARARENVALNGFTNVCVLEVALGADNGSAWLDTPTGVAARGRLSAVPTALAVSVRRLDSLLAEAKLPAPDFIKLDVEGAELAVLHGSELVLERCRPVLLIEVHPETQATALLPFLSSLGYDLHCVEARKTVRCEGDLPALDEVWHLAALPY